MAERVRAATMTHNGRYERKWVVYVDGALLRDGRGGARRFKTEGAARDAGWRNAGSTVPLGVPGSAKTSDDDVTNLTENDQ